VTEASQAHPVRLRGVVTALSGWQSSFFIQDSAGGISIDPAQPFPQIHAGQEVEIEGVTGSGRFAPIVVANSVTVLGEGRLPTARHIELADVANGNLDSQWVEATGVVVSAAVREAWGRKVLFLDLHVGGGTIVSVRVHDFPADSWRSLTGTSVSARGVCGTVFNDKRQFIGLRLFLNSLDNLQVLQKAPADPFDYPLQRLADLHTFDPDHSGSEFVRVRGIVTYPQFQQVLYIQDGTNGIAVHSADPLTMPAGTEVEAVGFLANSDYSPSLEYAQVRVLNSKPASVRAEPAVAAGMIGQEDGFAVSHHDSQLVQMKGVIVDNAPGAEEDVLFLKDGASIFTARLPRRQHYPKLPSTGSQVLVTGICVTRIDAAHEPKSFRLLLRSASDVAVVKSAPWWDISHATTVAEILGAALILMTVLMIVTRREAALRQLTLTDSLTGLYNRRGFVLLAEHQLQLAMRNQTTMLLFYIDIDHFKKINDTHGHKTGDAALEMVASILRETFRKADPIGRLGGDEFAVAAIDATSSAPEEIKKRLMDVLAKANQTERGFALSISVGVLICDATVADAKVEELLSRADELMYAEKRQRAG
jgi:diguanylate cyclase (GGDEF)-like protein